MSTGVETVAAKYVIQRFPDMYHYIKKYKTNIEELESKREELILKKDDITRQVETGEQRFEIRSRLTERWFVDVKKLMDDAEIKEIMNESTRTARDKCCFDLFLCDITYRYFTSKLAEEKANDIGRTLSNPPLPVTCPIDPKEMEVIPTEYLKGLKSRDELLDKILGMLQDDQVYFVGLCGMGAIGKTTLAKEVEQKATDFFDLIIMAEISEVPNIDSIQEQIATAIGLPLDGCCTTRQRAKKLYNRLLNIRRNESTNGKGWKTLIIMDNIWKKINLLDVGIPVEVEQTMKRCIKILFTSRKKDVCSVMDVRRNNIISVPILPENEAQQLFQALVGERHGNGDYKLVEERLLNKCGGLPLMIFTTARALKGKSYATWLHFATGFESSTYAHDETYTVLERSFNLIDNENTKKFFLLGCLFPLGSDILIDDMMKYGIGLELFQSVNNLNDAMGLVKRWADDLRSSSLLLENETEVFVKIHDVVRKFAIKFAEKDGQKMLVENAPKWLPKEDWGTYTAISLTCIHDYRRLSGLKFDMLEILLLQGNPVSEYETIEDKYFGRMSNLKVLGLTNMRFKKSLPKSITALKNLKTLLLEDCELNDIKLLSKLKSLLVLSFKGSTMKEIPKEIANLCNLRMMDLRVLYIADKNIPAGIIAKLSRLEGIYMCYDLQVRVADLNCLSSLGVVDQVYIPYTPELPIIGNFVNDLQKFRIFVGVPNPYRDFPPQLSCVLVIHKTSINYILNYGWLKVLLSKTEFLELREITGLKCLANDISHDSFMHLKHLTVKKCGMDCIINTKLLVDMESFPNLMSLSLSHMYKLKAICDGVITLDIFSNLRDVSLKELPKLETYALPMILGRRLTSIKVEYCEKLQSIFLGNDNELGTVVVFPCLKKLILGNLPTLRYFMTDEANCAATSDSPNDCQYLFTQRILLPSLEQLELTHICIRKLWDSPPNEQTCTSGNALDAPYFKSLQNLNCVTIESCGNLESLCSPSVAAHLLQLETLSIINCENMNTVLREEMHGEDPKEYNIFPKLTYIFLSNLINLRSFYEGNHQLQLNALKTLKLEKLYSIVSVAGPPNSAAFFNKKIVFPNLLNLTMTRVKKDVNEVKELWRPSLISNPLPKLKKLTLKKSEGFMLIPAIAFQQLSTLVLDGCDNKFVFSTSTPSAQGETSEMENQTPKLENLYLNNNELMEGLFENYREGSANVDDMVKKICGHLRLLELSSIEKINHLPLHLFTNLSSLSLNGMNLEYLFTSEMVSMGIGQLLPMLEEIKIVYCRKMRMVLDELGIGEDISAQVIVFPRLKRIVLQYLEEESRSFNRSANSTLHFPALEEVWVEHTKFQSLFSGEVIAPRLRTIKLENCPGMTRVFNAIELPSLMSLAIEDCPRLQSFSNEPLEAPFLNNIHVDNFEHPLELVGRANHPINRFLMNQYNERFPATIARQTEHLYWRKAFQGAVVVAVVVAVAIAVWLTCQLADHHKLQPTGDM